MRNLWRPFVALAFWALAFPADAADTPVDLELVLAVDVSGSIDEEEAALQREGYMAALVDADVIAAIRGGPTGRIALAYIEWSNAELQRIAVDWRVIDGIETAREFVAALRANPPVRGRFTSISGAIDYAVPMFQGNGFEGARRAVDVSGDGPNNRGRRVTDARDDAIARGITINGLPIVNDRPNFFGRPPADLDLYYRDCVIGGPGALYVIAKDFQSFANAIRRKLILEISGADPDPSEAKPLLHFAADEPSRCEMGESEFRGRFYQQYRN
jgi:hypothetical protein